MKLVHIPDTARLATVLKQFPPMGELATVSTAAIGRRDVAKRGRVHFIKAFVAKVGFFLTFVLGIVVFL